MTGYQKVVWEDVKRIANRDIPWEQLKNKTVLISGAAGFVPACLVYTLLCRNDMFNDNIRILALVRNKDKAYKRFADVRDRNDLNILVQDVEMPVDKDIAADFIIHAASPANNKQHSVNPVATLRANFTGTINMLDVAHRSDSKGFLYLSTGMVYGRVNEQKPINETGFGFVDPMDCRNVYSVAKRAGEMLCASYSAQYKVNAKVVRMFSIYGPGDDINAEHAFTDFTRDTYLGNDIRIKSTGDSIRSYCYIADAADAIFTVLLLGENEGAYNIGNDIDVLSIKSLAEVFAECAGNKGIKVICNAPDSLSFFRTVPDYFVPDISRLYSLGWRPQTDIRSGTIQDYAV